MTRGKTINIYLPEDKEELIKFLKDKRVYDDVSMVCYPKVNSKILKGEVEEGIKNMVEVVKDFRVGLSRRKDVED